MHGGHLWARHPAVRTGDQLSLGERAADRLKAAFGSWAFLIILNGFIAAWCVLNITGVVRFDAYPFIALNLVLSWLAAQQGGALQIAANRGDRINAEIATHTEENTTELVDLNRAQIEILRRLDGLDGKVADLAETIQQVMAARTGHDAAVAAEAKAARTAAESAAASARALTAAAAPAALPETATERPVPPPAGGPGTSGRRPVAGTGSRAPKGGSAPGGKM